ncbi:hypothetical protein M2451_000149 [Dysgonomonas sp. PFB1-18]|uniref:hypothetical protein n=1 Tax=unclassified Dysgonomonas TaxID=2630389 RepID=UPI002476FFF5|nr:MULTISPECIES: hypothetical protein [unclassified Dysgonomonas]MDH6307700.1 hypothetical protein [Dysgonomonas sp. PF1-14]MDH6337618.1 hypothetical protein [Dysgonomonas sp. PF1-16]MDH6378842.1 hypothetical protein [Dysgonomonas sp. PFB1-18]MDH6396477.1 hypothetical protein [Dysgonomonas sp. PF1-23]
MIKKLSLITFITFILSACGSPTQLLVRNDTTYNVDVYLTAYTKRFGSKYTVMPTKRLIVGEYKNNANEFVTTPYMFIRQREIVSDSTIYAGSESLSKLSIYEQDTLRVDNAFVDSIFDHIKTIHPKKKPKEIIWEFQDSLFQSGIVKHTRGLRLTSGRIIQQQPFTD